MSANPEKFKLMFLGRSTSDVELNIGDIVLMPNKSVKLLGVFIDRNLTFTHVQYLCKATFDKIWSCQSVNSMPNLV